MEIVFRKFVEVRSLKKCNFCRRMVYKSEKLKTFIKIVDVEFKKKSFNLWLHNSVFHDQKFHFHQIIVKMKMVLFMIDTKLGK